MSHPVEIQELPEKPKSNGKIIGAVATGVVVAVAAGFGIHAATSGGGDKLTVIKVGTTEASQDYWRQLKKIGKEKYKLDIQPVNFTDYTQADPALAQGQTDLNQFQHLQFLANYNVTANQNLTPIGSTYIVPLALYSKKHSQISQITSGKIAIPNDPTNEARALLLLQSAGLLSLKGGGNSLSTPADIDASASKVGVTPVDAAQTASALGSVTGSVVNNNFASDAGLDPSRALFKDDPKSKNSQPYINVVVARAQDANKDELKKFVLAYHDPSVQELVKKQTKDTSVEVNDSPAKLQSILSGLESAIKAKK